MVAVGRPIGPIFKGEAVHFCLWLFDPWTWILRVSRNTTILHSSMSSDLICTVAKAWNHAQFRAAERVIL